MERREGGGVGGREKEEEEVEKKEEEEDEEKEEEEKEEEGMGPTVLRWAPRWEAVVGGAVRSWGAGCRVGRTAAPRGPLDLRGMRWAPVREVFLRDHARISVAVTGDARGRGRGRGVPPSRRKATWIVHPSTSLS